MHREHSPLVQAEDAVYLDSSDMTLDQVVDAIGRLIDQKIDGQAGKAMNVTVAKTAGFCFGVKRAVEKVYEQIQKTDKPIYTYGPIIHNEEVVKDLKKKGRGGHRLRRGAGSRPGLCGGHPFPWRRKTYLRHPGKNRGGDRGRHLPLVKRSTGWWPASVQRDAR